MATAAPPPSSDALANTAAVVTGAGGCVGSRLVARLRDMGCDVLPVVREGGGGGGGGAFIEADVATVRGAAEAAEKAAEWAQGKPLRLLIHCAGVYAPPFTLTADGLEVQFATNFLARAVITHRLLPLMARAADQDVSSGHAKSALHGQARVVFVTSSLHYFTYRRQPPHTGRGTRHGEFTPRTATEEELPPGYVPGVKPPYYYDPSMSYGQSMLMNQLFVRQLALRLPGCGMGRVRAYAVHPGYTPESRGHHRHLPPWMRTLAETAAAVVVPALRPERWLGLPSGLFESCGNGGGGEAADDLARVGAGWALRDGDEAAAAVLYACASTSSGVPPSGSYLSGSVPMNGSKLSRDDAMGDELWENTTAFLRAHGCAVLSC